MKNAVHSAVNGTSAAPGTGVELIAGAAAATSVVAGLATPAALARDSVGDAGPDCDCDCDCG